MDGPLVMQTLDVSLFRFFFGLGQKIGADWLFVFLSDYLVYLMVVVFIGVVWYRSDLIRRLYIGAILILSEIISRGLITESIRYAWDRPRPFVALDIPSIVQHAPTASFPSGHTVFVFVLAFTMFAVNRRWGWIFTAMASLVGVARVIGGVHWVSDIIVGVLVAGIGVALVYWILLPPKKILTRPPEEAMN